MAFSSALVLPVRWLGLFDSGGEPRSHEHHPRATKMQVICVIEFRRVQLRDCRDRLRRNSGQPPKQLNGVGVRHARDVVEGAQNLIVGGHAVGEQRSLS